MGSDVSFRRRKDELEVGKPSKLDKGKGKDMSYFGIDSGEGEQTTSRGGIGDFGGGGRMHDQVVETKAKAQTQTSVGVKLEAGAATAMAGGGAKMERKAIKLGDEIRASGKTKELSRWWDNEKGEWGEIEVIELSDDED